MNSEIKNINIESLSVHPLCSMSNYVEDCLPATDISDGEKPEFLKPLDALIESIAISGVLHPLIIDERNQIIDGARRFNAAKIVGLTELPCVIIESKNVASSMLSDGLGKNITKTAKLWLTATIWYPIFCELRDKSIDQTGGLGRPRCSTATRGFDALALPLPDEESLEQINKTLDDLIVIGSLCDIKSLAKYMNVSRRSLDYVAEILDILSTTPETVKKAKVIVLNRAIFYSRCGAERLKSAYKGDTGNNTPSEEDKNFASNFEDRLKSMNNSVKTFLNRALRPEYFQNSNWKDQWGATLTSAFSKVDKERLQILATVINNALKD